MLPIGRGIGKIVDVDAGGGPTFRRVPAVCAPACAAQRDRALPLRSDESATCRRDSTVVAWCVRCAARAGRHSVLTCAYAWIFSSRVTSGAPSRRAVATIIRSAGSLRNAPGSAADLAAMSASTGTKRMPSICATVPSHASTSIVSARRSWRTRIAISHAEIADATSAPSPLARSRCALFC
jgi:hypothetical protein